MSDGFSAVPALTSRPVGTPGEASTSAASSFDAPAIAQLVTLAAGLPEGWCLAFEPPHGQLVITPIRGYHFAHMAMAVAPDGRHGPTLVHAAR